MAERSKALRSGRSLVLQAWVRIPLLTNTFHMTLKLNIADNEKWNSINTIHMRWMWDHVNNRLFRMCRSAQLWKVYAVLAEWLRRQTRNLLGSARAGSNPADCARRFWGCGFEYMGSVTYKTTSHCAHLYETSELWNTCMQIVKSEERFAPAVSVMRSIVFQIHSHWFRDICLQNPSRMKSLRFACCDGRVVKALDLKSNGIFPRRFEPCSQRNMFCRRRMYEPRA